MMKLMQFSLWIMFVFSSLIMANDTPQCIINPETAGYPAVPVNIGDGIYRQQLYPTAIAGGDSLGRGLIIDLKDSTLFGTIHAGVFYFEHQQSDYLMPRYREASKLKNGRGLIKIKYFIKKWSKINVNRWTDEGTVAYRLDLWRKKDDQIIHLGFHDSNVNFRYVNGKFEKRLSITEGPMINLVNSDHPDWMVISLETDEPSTSWIEVKNHDKFSSTNSGLRHEIKVENLSANKTYEYRVFAATENDTINTPWLSFKSAPPLGSKQITFAYTGDGRAGNGGGEHQYMGVNQATLKQTGAAIFRHKAAFLLFNGDMVSGYTNNTNDILMQFKAFKQSLFGYTAQRPLYTGIGNHEALLNKFDDGSRWKMGMDKWPYEKYSVEKLLGDEFVNPTNAPKPYKGLPPYRENVYSFHYGNIKVIVCNNNYWWTSHNKIAEVGGCPEGYFLPNQIEWIEQEIESGEKNEKIDHIFLMAHEPFFPNGGHVGDAMWNRGNNLRRAYIKKGDKLIPFEKGLIEVRNYLWKLAANSKKLSVVLGSDEHAYHRTLITNKTPVGVFPKDDRDNDGKLDEGNYSANSDFKYPTWFIVGGGAGAPYYTPQKTPWQDWRKYYTSQTNYLIFESDGDKLHLRVYSLSGQLLDEKKSLKIK